MGLETEISWCDATLNLWWGCVEVAPECDNCYAREWAARYDRAVWGAAEPRLAIKSAWSLVDKLQRDAAKAGRVARVFCGSMMDIFEKPQPLAGPKGEKLAETTGGLRDRLFTEIVPRCPNLLFLFLTKRPGNITKYIPPAWLGDPPDNVMFGTSAGCQATADVAIPALLASPGRHFLSCEPMIGPVVLGHHLPHGGWGGAALDWVIGGGESGPKARPCHPDWARGLRDQCQVAGVPFHWKQWGEWAPFTVAQEVAEHAFAADGGDPASPVGRGIGPRRVAPNPAMGHLLLRSDGSRVGSMEELANENAKGAPIGDVASMYRLGKKAAGRLLDGQVWDEFPRPKVEATTAVK